MSIISKKVQRTINENILTLEDIQTRKEWWKKPTDEDYIELKIFPGWKAWQKNYKFIPTPNKWAEIKKETEEKLQTIPAKDYFVIRNKDNVMTIVLQNIQSSKQIDFSRPDIALFFGKNPRQPLIPWRMYFIDTFDYIDNRTLYCQITAYRDYLWDYYGNFCNSQGQAKISHSQINNNHIEHKDDTGQNALVCPACDSCFDFCGDLRIKRAVPPGSNAPQTAQWQPKWKIIYTYPKSGGSCSSQYLKDAEMSIPNNLHLQAWYDGAVNGDFWNAGQPALLFLVDKNHPSGGAFSQQDNSLSEYWEELPQCYNKQPHLLNHSSVQFFFQKKLLTTGNLKHLKVRRRNGKLFLVYKIKIRSSVAGIYYMLECGEIFSKWELKVRGTVLNQSIMAQMAGSVIKGAFAGAIGGAIKGFFTGGPAGAAAGGVAGGVKGGADGAKEGGNNLSNILTGKRFEELLDIQEDGNKNQEKAENEQQTERQKKSTAKSQNRIVEPAIFYSNTVDFNYDFWEFANRAIMNPFEVRFEHSELLYNNLKQNNNASPIQNIQCRFSQFKQTMKVGYWQGQVDLWWDIDDFFKGILAQGTFFYDNDKELFKPWKPSYETLQSYTFGALSGIDASQGEEEVEITKIDKEEVLPGGGFNKGDAHASFTTYFRVPDDNLYNQITPSCGAHKGENWNSKAPDKRNAVCWGCSIRHIEIPIETGGTVYTYFNQNQSGENTMEIPDNCILIIDTAKGEFRAKTSEEQRKYHFRAEREQADREETYQSQQYEEPDIIDNNTQFHSNVGEVDPEGFDWENPETDPKETDFDKPETELKEKGGETEKDFEKELEKEKEKEKETEKERELERELEREKEKEREQERELEKEKQREREKQTEQEKKQRDSQVEKDKKEKDRKEREAKLRERQQQKERDKKEKEKREKERKEKE